MFPLIVMFEECMLSKLWLFHCMAEYQSWQFSWVNGLCQNQFCNLHYWWLVTMSHMVLRHHLDSMQVVRSALYAHYTNISE